jgi:GNAT superfamily N-acetyltransferase
MPVELRVLTPDEWETWRVIRLEALAEAPYAFGSRHADWVQAPEDRWRDRLGLAGSHNLVAFMGSTPVGMATGVPDGEAVELISMYVGEPARGTGVADALVGGIEDWARARGSARLCLNVRMANTAARRLYERHGLVVTGEAERVSPDDPIELRMCKTLG